MGWWNRAFKSVVHTVSHPVQAVKKVAATVVKAEKKMEKNIVKAAVVIEKVGEKTIPIAHKALDGVANNAKVIKEVVNVSAGIIEVIGIATGQPEITAGAAALQVGIDKAVDLAAKADKALNTAEKVVAVAKMVKEKENIATVLHGVADVMGSAAEVRGDKKLAKLAKDLKRGAGVVDASVKHGKIVLGVVQKVHSSVKKKDLKGVVVGVVDVVKVGIKTDKLIKDIKNNKLVVPKKVSIPKLSAKQRVKKLQKTIKVEKKIVKAKSKLKKDLKKEKKDMKKLSKLQKKRSRL